MISVNGQIEWMWGCLIPSLIGMFSHIDNSPSMQECNFVTHTHTHFGFSTDRVSPVGLFPMGLVGGGSKGLSV